jgi:hypothetical protein
MADVRYVIEGGVVQREEISRGAAVPLESMLSDLTSFTPLDMNHLPKGIRAIKVEPIFERDASLSLRVLVEQEPRMRTIRHKEGSASSRRSPNPYRIQLPYVLFWSMLRGTKSITPTGERIIWAPQGWGNMWSNQPYSGWQTPTWFPKFPNLFGDTRICFGGVRQNVDQPLGSYIDSSINGYWTSEFNNDIGWSGPVGNGSMSDWEADESDWQEWDIWSQSPTTIETRFTQFETNFEWSAPVPMDAGQPIPEIRMLPTFESLGVWLDNLTTEQRERVIYTVLEEGHGTD